MTAPDDSLSPRQHAAISALLTAKSITEAATRAKVAEATLRRWLTADLAFQRAYRAARRAVMDGVIGRVQQVAVKAVTALERHLNAKGGRPADQIRAALGILDFATRGLEVGDLLERVEELERLATGEGGGEAPQAAGQAGRATPDNGD
jgi:hypothetical protein